MSKVRVYQVARELGLPNRDLIQRIHALGIQVRNHMSVLDPTEVERVKRAVSEKSRGGPQEEVKQLAATVRRRRRKAPKAPEPEARAEAPTPRVEPTPKPAREPAPPKSEVVEPPQTPPRAEAASPEPPVALKPSVPEKVVTEPKGPAQDAAPEPASRETEAADAKAKEPAEAKEAAEAKGPAEAKDVAAESAPKENAAPKEPPKETAPPAPPKRKPTTIAPPGVGMRKALSDAERKKIVEQHQQSRPRRRVMTRANIGPSARPQSRGRRSKLPRDRKPKQTEITVPSAHKRVVQIDAQVSLQNLAQRMSLKATDLLMKLMQMGMSGVHINSTLDADTAMIIAEEFGYQVENVAKTTEEVVEDARGDFEDREEDRVTRPPVVTIMGHVDHGKTSVLDKIRSANVAAGEAGGITQHISAFRVDTKKGTVVFLDTPGHEAFTEMRSRGAQATDVVILVVAADDGMMPQTKEAIDHAKAAEVPIIVALNKIDKPEAQPERVMNELAAYGLQPEQWGGETIYVETSAITGQGLDSLLDSVLLQAEMLELKANPKIPAEGVVLEARLDRGRGVVANVLIRDGSLSPGDYVVAGAAWGRVRALTDDRGQKLKKAGPATPVELLGLDQLPDAGDRLYKVTNAKKAQEVAEANRSPEATVTAPRGLEHFQQMMASGEQQELQLVLKADVQGSVEALRKSLEDLSTDKVRVKIVRYGVGGITENDVSLASASEGVCIVLGFNVRPQGKAGALAKKDGVEIRTYNVIYEAIDDVKAAMAGLLAPKLVDVDLGKAEVRQTFSIPKVGTIAGCMVTEGKILRSGKARLVRDGIVVWDGKLSSLRRFKDSVREVASGFECGIGLEAYNDIKVGDVIECYEVKEVAASLEDVG